MFFSGRCIVCEIFVKIRGGDEEAWEKSQRSTCYRGDLTNPLQNILREGNGIKNKERKKHIVGQEAA